MPAADTLLHFQRDLRLDQRWLLDGTTTSAPPTTGWPTRMRPASR